MSLLITNISHGWKGDASGTRIRGAIRIEGNRITMIGELQACPDDDIADAGGQVSLYKRPTSDLPILSSRHDTQETDRTVLTTC